jgi:hypothetical protein
MRLVTYSQGPAALPRAGVRVGHRVLDIESASRVDGEPLPNTLRGLLREGRGALSRVQALAKAAQSSAGRFSGAMLEERAIRFLAPLPDADKLLCAGNGAERLNAGPLGHNAKVVKPNGVARLDCEPALVFVVGRGAESLSGDEDAMDFMLGVTLLNDLTDRDRREATALGPEIVTLDELGDPYDQWMVCTVNGEERLRMNTGQIPRIGEVLQRLSRNAPIEPGDLVSTGAPGDLFLQPGDVVECSLEGVTTLRNTIVAE